MILSYIYVCQREKAFVYCFFFSYCSISYTCSTPNRCEFCYLIEWDSILSIRIERAPKHFICPGNVIRIFKWFFFVVDQAKIKRPKKCVASYQSSFNVSFLLLLALDVTHVARIDRLFNVSHLIRRFVFLLSLVCCIFWCSLCHGNVCAGHWYQAVDNVFKMHVLQYPIHISFQMPSNRAWTTNCTRN